MLVGAAIGGGDVVLTGGSTPQAAYAEFAEAVQIVGLDLADTTFWIGDERCVAARRRARQLPDDQGVAARAAGGPDRPAREADQGRARPGRGSRRLRARADGRPGRPSSTCCCSDWAPTVTPLRCSPTSRRSPSARSWWSASEAGLEPFVPRVSFTFPVIARPGGSSCWPPASPRPRRSPRVRPGHQARSARALVAASRARQELLVLLDPAAAQAAVT